MVVKTVEEIKRNFTKREVEAAEQARRLCVIMGRPSGQTFVRVIRQGLVLNNPVTIQDYRNALQIYGEDLGVLKGKTVRTKPEHVKIEIDSVTPCKQIGIILSADIMYFTGLAFLIMVSRSIGFITATLLADRKKQTILEAMKQIMNLYRNRGHEIKELDFNVQGQPIHTILVDNEFQVLKEEIETLGVNINVVSKDEHVPEVERQNRVIKERVRAIVQTMPYQKLPKKMRIALIQYVVYWLNNIPKEGQEMSPREIIIGTQKLDFKNVCRIPFGAYAQVHNDLAMTNTMDPRTTGAICLGPSGNIQGGHKFLSLQTGNIMVRRKWTELPVPADVINRLKDLAQDVNDSVEQILEEESEEDNNKELELNQNQDDSDSIKTMEEFTERNDDEQQMQNDQNTEETQINEQALYDGNEQEQIQHSSDNRG
jgi:hypothetical protein